jgi:hypothetical protein
VVSRSGTVCGAVTVVAVACVLPVDFPTGRGDIGYTSLYLGIWGFANAGLKPGLPTVDGVKLADNGACSWSCFDFLSGSGLIRIYESKFKKLGDNLSNPGFRVLRRCVQLVVRHGAAGFTVD